jgi:excisionase family DNA binding protein
MLSCDVKRRNGTGRKELTGVGSKQPEREIGPPLMLTYREAARKLGVSDSFVYRLLREGEIHSVELGPQTLRIPLSECEAYVAALIARQIAPSPEIVR